jgi:hypothetical protein
MKLKNEHIQNLSEDELAMLLFIVNAVSPKILNYEITPNLIPSINHDALTGRVLQCEQFIKDEYKHIFNEMKRKLEMPYTPPPEPPVDSNNNLNNSQNVVT